jgi:hypothetical protein
MSSVRVWENTKKKKIRREVNPKQRLWVVGNAHLKYTDTALCVLHQC